MQHIKEIKLTLFFSKFEHIDSFKPVSSESFFGEEVLIKQMYNEHVEEISNSAEIRMRCVC
jgi:hypothetical protein